METPKYHFFKDELESHEIQYYSNGTRIDQERWSTDEIATCVNKIKEELFKRGYRLARLNGQRSLYFTKPEGVSAAYIGTFLNTFSCHQKIWNWYNQFSTSAKYITVSEVERGNGTVKNQSVAIGVLHFPGSNEVKYYTSENKGSGGQINEYGVEIPKTYDWCSAGGKSGKGERVKKFRVETKDSTILKYINEAEVKWQAIEIEDQSRFERDPADFPPSTEKEYWAYREENKNK